MSRKGPKGHVIKSEKPLKDRVRRAQAEGRFQNALELAKQLYRQEPTAETRQILKEVTVGRADELYAAGKKREAAVCYRNGLHLDSLEPDWVRRIAKGLAQCGEAAAALELVGHLPDGAPDDLLGKIADSVVELEGAGREALPEKIRVEYDLVRTACKQVEEGSDEAARETLQAIGLRSPFLEWKIMLRGLVAYYANDDARALENWLRLKPDRLPARLVAPFRGQIDAAFLRAQPAPTQNLLRKQLAILQGTTAAQQLRSLAPSFGPDKPLAGAFRQVEGLLPLLRQEAPAIVPRLAHCFYWAILDVGPDEILRYRRVFGAPADDPAFSRLEAMACEKNGMFEEAHEAWQKYERDLEGMASQWPAGQAKLARALVWAHMGQEAAMLPSAADRRMMPAFLLDHPLVPKSLKPTAEQCFRKSLELDPTQRTVYEELYRLHEKEGRLKAAEKAARDGLKQHPDHVYLLEKLGTLCLEGDRPSEGLALLQQALRADPLRRQLRDKVSHAHMVVAREHVLMGRFDDAREHYALALSDTPGGEVPSVYCRMAACEFKAGESARAESFLEKAREAGGHPLFIAYMMLTEVGRLPLPKALKARFEASFAEGLALPPSTTAAAQLISFNAAIRESEVVYPGGKGHDKKIVAYLKRSLSEDFAECDYERAVRGLLAISSRTLVQTMARRAKKLYPHNPIFPLAEAESLCDGKLERIPFHKVRPLLERAERLAQALPREHPRRDDLLEIIGEKLEALKAIDPFGGNIFSQIFEAARTMDDFDPDEFSH